MSELIPFLNLPVQHEPLKEEMLAAFSKAIDTARFIGGPPVEQFENDFANFCQKKYCVGVANGTDALTLSLRTLGIGPGDVVLVPAFTFIATAEAVTQVGATPRFIDIDPLTYSIDIEKLLSTNHDQVKAIIPVHLYGQPADIGSLVEFAREKGWYVVEDCAQAHGAQYNGKPVGSFGDFGAFSFYPGKNLGAFGDGGAVVSDNKDLITHLRNLSDHGRITRNEHCEHGVNSRLDSIQAQMLSIKLPHLKDWNAARNQAAKWYNERFTGVKGIAIPRVANDRTHVYHLYVIQIANRERLQQILNENNIQSGLHYPIALPLQPAYKFLGHGKGDFPVAEGLANRCLSLPMFPGITQEQVDRVAKIVIEHANVM